MKLHPCEGLYFKDFSFIFNITYSILLLFLFTNGAVAQYPKDTSFTIHSAFLKERKKNPFIEIAKPVTSKKVLTTNDIVYSSTGSRPLHLDIFYPSKKSKKGYPGVLLIHGGGWRSGDKSQQGPLAQELAAKGYVAVTAEYQLSLEAPYPAAVYDLKAAVRWMRANAKQYNLDTTKIAALGCSAGGQLAALIGTTNSKEQFEGTSDNRNHSSSVQAIIDIDGILAFKHPESEEGKTAALWLGGDYEQKPEIWEEASPLNHVDKNTPPTLFINSALPRFHAGREDMIKKLNTFGIYSEAHTIPNTPHPFWLFHPWFKPTVNYIGKFLEMVFE